MEKDYKILMILVSLLLWGSGLRALDQKDGVYQIYVSSQDCIGSALVAADYPQQIGADAYSENANEAVAVAWQLLHVE